MKNGIAAEQAKNQILLDNQNKLEQHSRKNSIRIFGIRDTNVNESIYATEELVIKFLKEKLKALFF